MIIGELHEDEQSNDAHPLAKHSTGRQWASSIRCRGAISGGHHTRILWADAEPGIDGDVRGVVAASWY